MSQITGGLPWLGGGGEGVFTHIETFQKLLQNWYLIRSNNLEYIRERDFKKAAYIVFVNFHMRLLCLFSGYCIFLSGIGV